MRSLKTYIYESSSNNDLEYLLQKWFAKNDSDLEEFTLLVNQYIENPTITARELYASSKGMGLGIRIDKFIDFVDGEVQPTLNKDYASRLSYIVKAASKIRKYNKRSNG